MPKVGDVRIFVEHWAKPWGKAVMKLLVSDQIVIFLKKYTTYATQ
jgi:hypothetical protein